MKDYCKPDLERWDVGPCVPKQESEVFSKIDEIHEALSCTDELISTLERRLNPILQSYPEEGYKDVDGLTGYKTQLSGSLGELYFKVRERNKRLENIISNIVI